MVQFAKATKAKSKLRLALIGIAGTGKTYTALSIASNLGKKIAVVDTEHGSASKYADLFSFDTIEPDSFHPSKYIEAITAAEAGGYDVLIIDSLSHAWMGKDGALELVDRAAKRSTSGNSFTAWRDVTPLHNQLVEAMIQSKLHLIVTLRAKTEYVMEQNDKGKSVPRKVGMAPIQRDGLEYEFDVVADLNIDNDFVVSKTRCPLLKDAVVNRAGKQIADVLREWLGSGIEKAVHEAIAEVVEAINPVVQTKADINKQALIFDKLLTDAENIAMVGTVDELTAWSHKVAEAAPTLGKRQLADLRTTYKSALAQIEKRKAA